MITHLQTVTSATLCTFHHLLHTMASVHSEKDRIVQYLHTQLDTGGTQHHGTADLLIIERVRTCLHGQSDTPVLGYGVPRLCGLDIGGVTTIHCIEAPLNEPFLIIWLSAGECSAHDDEVDLVGPVPDLLQLTDAIGHLHPRIELVTGCTSGCWLFTGV